MNRPIQPKDWSKPSGFSHGIVASGRQIFIAGQIGCDEHGRIVSGGFADQSAQALRNIATVLASADALPEHVVRLTWYVTDMREYSEARTALGSAYRAIFGEHYPAMTLIAVSALFAEGAKVEIEATAVVP